MIRPRLLAALSSVLLVAACDSAGPLGDGAPDEGNPTPEAPSAQAVPVELGADFPDGRGVDFGVYLEYYFNSPSYFQNGPASTTTTSTGLSMATLLLTGTQDGRTRYGGGNGPLRLNTAPCDGLGFGTSHPFFRLASGVEYEVGDWPVERGAPLTEAGAPRVYGDLMAWGAYCTGHDTPDGNREPAPPEDVLQDLRINHAAFQHERAGLEGVRFFRYEITNLGDSPVTDLRAALFSDPDLGGLSDGQHYRRNLMGSTDRYAYVYTSDAVSPTYRGAALALALLETPKGVGETVRRVIYRDRGPAPEQAPFTHEALDRQPRPTVFHALQGLDDDGDAIVNLVTGATTTVMYDGDPVARTGWLDGTLPGGEKGWDIRVIQSTEPFTLSPGETVVLTAVGVAHISTDRATGLDTVDGIVREVSADPSLWRFPIASP